MRFSIRYQLLLPLLALMLGLVGASTWSAWSSGQRARQQIEKQIDDIVRTVKAGRRFPLNTQILHWMKALSGAEFIVCDAKLRPIREDDKLFATLDAVTDPLPSLGDEPSGHFDRPVRL